MNEMIQQLAEQLIERGHTMGTAESCTGGMVAAQITAVNGSSKWFECGIVTYSNESKQMLLGVDAETLEQFGAVSEPVVIQMVEGLLARTNASVGVSISGVAGPGGGSEQKPVGTVFFAWAGEGFQTRAQRMQFDGDREAVRKQATEYALRQLFEAIS